MARFIIEHAPSFKNEDKVIHAAKRWLEFITGDRSTSEVKPDLVERRKPDVDLTFYIKKQKYALEHTCIEAFPHELQCDGFWNDHLGSKIRELEADLNTSLMLSYDLTLYIPNNIVVPKKNLALFLNKIKNWVISQSIALGEFFPESVALMRVCISNSKYTLKLSRSRVISTTLKAKGRFNCIRLADSDETQDRELIIKKAFHAKAKKLSVYKKNGAKSVLVIEWRYRIPTPYSPIIYAHKILKESYSNSIDMIILVGMDIKEWAIKYTETGLELSRKELMENWWLYDWETDRIRKYTWA